MVPPAQPSPTTGPWLTRARVGLSPTSPHSRAGMRIDPPPSLACATGTMPLAPAAAGPPEDPPGEGPGVPAGGPASRVAGVPRVARRRERLRLGGHGRAELRHVGAAQGDEAGGEELLGEEGRHRPREVLQRTDADGGRLAGDRAAEILEQDRDAAERTVRKLAPCCRTGLVEPGADDGVEVRVDGLDP